MGDWPHITTAEDYARYKMAFDDGMKGMHSLSQAVEEDGTTETPFFSYHNCDICHRNLGGDRLVCTALIESNEIVKELEVCQDCLYFHEYGQLDDMTMMDMEEDGDEG